MVPLFVFGPIVAVLSVLGVGVKRKTFSFALTAERAVLFQNDWRGRPSKIVATFSDLNDVGPLNDTEGDLFVVLGGQKFWMNAVWTGQLYRIRKIRQARSSSTPSDQTPSTKPATP